MMDFRLAIVQQNQFSLVPQGQQAIVMKPSLSCRESTLETEKIVTQGKTATITYRDGSTVNLSFVAKGNLFVIDVTWHFAVDGPYRLHLTCSMEDGGKNSIFIPATWYQDNEKGEGCFPSKTRSDHWSFLETRMSVPCAIEMTNVAGSLSLATTAASKEEELASLSWDRSHTTFTIPGAEWPMSYRGKKELADTTSETKPFLWRKAGDAYHRQFYLFPSQTTDMLENWDSFLRLLQPFFATKREPSISWDEYGMSKLTRLLSLVRKDQNEGAFFAMGEGNGEEQDVYEFTSASFLVKGVEAAYAMARAPSTREIDPHLQAARTRLSKLFSITDDHLLLPRLAERIGDYYLQAESQEGVFQDCHDLKSGIWGGYLGIGEHPEFRMMVNSRCNGEAMKSYLLLYQTLKKQGIVKDEYLSLAKRVARFYLDCQLPNGSFGRWWTTKGRPGNTQGTNGAYIVSFFCTFLTILDKDAPLTGEIKASLLKAETFYASLIENGLFYGDTLDADSSDKEAGVILLSIALDAWELTREERYVTLAKRAASFVLTWMWQVDAYLPPDSPMGKRHFHTRGMTAVSIAHHHLDFYGMAIAVDLCRLADVTGDGYYRQCTEAMMDACRQLIADERDPLGRDSRFFGWQPEQLNHTDWDYFNREDHMRGHFDIDIAWVNVLGYDSYLTLREKGELS